MQDKTIITTKKWINSFVIGLNICPFAKKSFIENRIYYVVSDWTVDSGDIAPFLDFVYEMDERDPAYSNGFFIIPGYNGRFEEFLGVIDGLEKLLTEKELDEEFQLVGFHPEFMFAGSDAEDAGNYVNRSPFPMIHLIRRADLDRAESTYPGIDKVPYNNEIKLKGMGVEAVRRFLNDAGRVD